MTCLSIGADTSSSFESAEKVRSSSKMEVSYPSVAIASMLLRRVAKDGRRIASWLKVNEGLFGMLSEPVRDDILTERVLAPEFTLDPTAELSALSRLYLALLHVSAESRTVCPKHLVFLDLGAELCEVVRACCDDVGWVD
ncbi:hypothetical protein ACEPAI_6678 [Sanghuangporus weigelae]